MLWFHEVGAYLQSKNGVANGMVFGKLMYLLYVYLKDSSLTLVRNVELLN